MTTRDPFDEREAIIRWSTMVVVQCERLEVEGPAALRVKDLERGGTIARDYEMLYIAQADMQFLFVALRNLMRALDVANYGRLPDDLGDKVVLMRDVLEHWDEFETEGKRLKGKAGRQYRETYPDSHPLDDLRIVNGVLEVSPGVMLSRLLDMGERLIAYVKYPWARVYPPPGPEPRWPLEGSQGG